MTLNNEERRMHGYKVLTAHPSANPPGANDIDKVLRDVLTDLMHYCHGTGDCDFDRALEMARIHFDEEA